MHCSRLWDPNLAVNLHAVIVVPPLIGTELDLQGIGEAGDESILERNQDRTSDNMIDKS